MYQKEYRKKKEREGWKYFSAIVPPDFYIELKKFYLQWKINKLSSEK